MKDSERQFDKLQFVEVFALQAARQTKVGRTLLALKRVL
jgi:hypothetical protein